MFHQNYQTNLNSLFVPRPGDRVWGRLGVCPMLRSLLLLRPEIAAQFDIESDAGLADALAWMYARALPEYQFQFLVDDQTRTALNAPADGAFDVTIDNISVEMTVLMGLVWRHRSDVQILFDIHSSEGRMRYCLWFVTHGVSEMGLGSLVSPEWRKRLLMPLPNGLSPLALIAWHAREDLQEAFDPRTPAGVSGLRNWTFDTLHSDINWSWLLSAPIKCDRNQRWQTQPDSIIGVNLIGFAKGELGIGEDVRMAVAACEAAGIPYSVVNIAPGPNTRQTDTSLDKHISAPSRAPYPINIFCLTGFETFRVFFEHGPHLFANRVNIGWWPWELPVWPIAWQSVLDMMDEIWAATHFTREMYAKVAPDKTIYMPMSVSIARSQRTSRRQLGLPATKFLFLYIFDFNSYLARKNPFAAVKSFRRAFPASDTSVGLVLKTMNSNPKNPVWRRFLRECAKDDRIIVLEKTLERGEVLGLIDACDAYVSLHRSEGFGRTLAEAMLFGKPVVGTDFSGNVDFLTPETGFPVNWSRRPVKPHEYPFVTDADNAWWAEPDISHAAQQLRTARNAVQDKQFLKKIRSFAQHEFAPERIGILMKRRLEEIASSFKQLK